MKSKFGKHKYNKGRLVEGQWVLGRICREDKEIFLIPVASHDKETLIPLLIERIRPGSIIYSDCWKSYDCLDQYDFSHLTVNHSLNFIDPMTGCHTQNVESMWWSVKRSLPDTMTRHGQLDLHLAEYLCCTAKTGKVTIYSKNFSQMLQDTIQDLHVICYYYIFGSIVIIQCLNFVLKIFLISVILEILS